MDYVRDPTHVSQILSVCGLFQGEVYLWNFITVPLAHTKTSPTALVTSADRCLLVYAV